MSSAPSKAQDQRQVPGQPVLPDTDRRQVPVQDPGQPARWSIEPAGTGTMEHQAGAEADARSASPGPAGSTGRKWRWMAFGVVITAAAMDLLDSTIAQVAAPTIRRELGGSYAVIEWVTAAYALAMAVGLLTGGRLGDIFGRRRMLLTGMAGFVAASAACAAAGTAGELIAARAAAGLLGAIMLPQVFGLIRDLFAAHEMGKAFGVYGPVMGLSAILGPIASGGLISANLFGTGWRMIFAVNVPVGLAALALGARLLPAGTGAGAGSGADAGSGAGAGSGGRRLGRGRGAVRAAGPAGRGAGRRGHVLAGLPAGAGPLAGLAGLAVRDAGRVGARARRVRLVPGPPPARGPRPAGGAVPVPARSVPRGHRVLDRVHRLAGRHRDDLQRVPAERTGLQPVALGHHHRAVGGGRVRRLRGRRHRDEQARPPGAARRARHRGGRAAGDLRDAARRGWRRLHRGPAGADGGRRDRDGHGVRAAVRHRDGRRPAARDGLGLRRPADGELARHVARHRRDRRDLLRPGGRPRRSRAGLPGRRGVDRARHGGAAGLLVRGGLRAAPAGQGAGRAGRPSVIHRIELRGLYR